MANLANYGLPVAIVTFRDEKMRADYYFILDGHEPVPVDDVLEWGKWFSANDERRVVAQTKIDEATVSTVFLGLNHQFGIGPPILFETMIFGGALNEYQVRYATWDEAVAGHEHAIEELRKANRGIFKQVIKALTDRL